MSGSEINTLGKWEERVEMTKASNHELLCKDNHFSSEMTIQKGTYTRQKEMLQLY